MMSDQFENDSGDRVSPGDEALDLRIAEAFSEGFSSVEPSEQYRQHLKARLEERLAETHSGSVPGEVGESVEPAADRPLTRSAVTRSAVTRSAVTKSAGAWRRVSFGLVAAAVAMVVLVLWPARQVYSFDAMRARLSDESFLRINFQDRGQAFVGWVSSDGQFAAVESSRLVVWAVDGTSASFDRSTQQATPLAEAGANESGSQVRALRVLDALRGDGSSGLRVVDESWERVDSFGGADGVLRVRFSGADSSQPDVNVSFGVNSSTGLPVWIDLSDGLSDDQHSGSNSDRHLRMPFAYPKKGPTRLTSLGVPPDWASAISAGSAAGPATDSLSMGNPDAKAPDASGSKPLDSVVALSGDAKRRLDMQADDVEQEPDSIAVSPKREVSLSSGVDTETWTPTKPTRKWPQPLPVVVPSGSQAMADRIDERLAAVWADEGLELGLAADAPTLFRRMHLDLAGRIPHVAEIRQGIDGGKFDVGLLLEEMLDSPDYDSNMASVWVRWLLPPDVELEQFGGKPALQAWLADQFEARVPYDQVVRQLLTAEGRVGDPGPVLFTTALEMKPDHLAKQTARTFLGTRIDCAMCHDHPYDTWTQTDFWGYAALFARISRPQGKMNVMSRVLQVRDVGEGEVTFPDTEIVARPRLLGGDVLDEQAESDQRRRRLADWITDPGNRQFSRATVNLLWSHFFGAGLVHPRDDFGSHNPALSPELLDELAAFFIENDYDIRSLVSAIVLSDAYQQSSQSESDADRPMFNTMPIRWLTAEQLYDCLLVASGGAGNAAVDFDPTLGLNRINNSARDLFVQQFGSTSDSVLEYQAGIPQALSLMNGSLSNRYAGEDTSRLLLGLRAPFFGDADRIETVFLSLVGRPPSQRESDAVNRMLEEDSGDSPGEVLSDLVWALLNSAEFATNH